MQQMRIAAAHKALHSEARRGLMSPASTVPLLPPPSVAVPSGRRLRFPTAAMVTAILPGSAASEREYECRYSAASEEATKNRAS